MQAALETLLARVADAFEGSDIKRYAEAHGHAWSYSLLVSPLKPRIPLVVGFNWGAEKDERYGPQRSIEACDWKGDVGSLERLRAGLNEYLPEGMAAEAVSQSNFCFFRSKDEEQITARDRTTCAPLFRELVAILEPSMLFVFSAVLRDHLIDSKQATFERFPIRHPDGRRTYEAMRGKYRPEDLDIDIVSLPHPMAHLPTEVRKAAWKACFVDTGGEGSQPR